MRRQISEDTHRLEITGVLPPSAVGRDTRSPSLDTDSDDAENALSDWSGSAGDNGVKIRTSKPAKTPKKLKAKFGKLGGRRSKVPDAQLDAEWDEKLEFGRRA